MRLYGLGNQSLWSDEIGSVMVAQQSILHLIGFVGLNDINPPGFYLLLNSWLVFGESDFFVRLLPCILGALTIPTVYFVVKKMYSKTIGLSAAALLTFSPLHIYYSQELRYQTLLTLVAFFSWYLFWRCLNEDDKRNGLLYIIATASGCYIHYSFLLMPVAQFAYLVFTSRKDLDQKIKTAKHIKAVGIAFIPGALIAVIQYVRGNALIKSYAPKTNILVNLRDASHSFVAGQSPKRPATLIEVFDNLFAYRPGTFWILFFLLMLPVFFVFFTGVRRFCKSPTGQMLLFYFLFPLSGILFLSSAFPVFETKLLVPLLPPFFVIFAGGATVDLKRFSPVGLVVSAFLIIVFLLSFHQMHEDSRYHRDNWRGLARMIEQQEEKGDALVNFSFEMKYYFKGNSPFADIDSIPINKSSQQVFSLDEKESTWQAKKLAGYYQRLWIRKNQYNSIKWLNDFLNSLKKNTFDLTEKSMDGFGIPVALWATPLLPLKEHIVKFAQPVIDFSNRKFDLRQLTGFWMMTDDGWAWASNSAKAFLKVPPGANRIVAEVFVNTDILPEQNAQVEMLVDGVSVSREKVLHSKRFGLSAPVASELRVICVQITSNNSIVPDSKENIPEQRKRTLLVQKIEVLQTPDVSGKDSDF